MNIEIMRNIIVFKYNQNTEREYIVIEMKEFFNEKEMKKIREKIHETITNFAVS